MKAHSGQNSKFIFLLVEEFIFDFDFLLVHHIS